MFGDKIALTVSDKNNFVIPLFGGIVRFEVERWDGKSRIKLNKAGKEIFMGVMGR